MVEIGSVALVNLNIDAKSKLQNIDIPVAFGPFQPRHRHEFNAA